MNANETIKEIMIKKEISQNAIQNKLGMKSQSGVSQALRRDMRVSMLFRFMNVLGCDLIIRDRETGETYEIAE